MMIDTETAKNLELVGNLSKKKNNHSLFGRVTNIDPPYGERLICPHSTLNYTYTAMASRLLRVNLLAPITGPAQRFAFDHFLIMMISTVQSSIDARLDTVEGDIENCREGTLTYLLLCHPRACPG
jgi:DNA mismatch repair protein MSH4